MTDNLLKISEKLYKNADYEAALEGFLAYLKTNEPTEKLLVLIANSYDFLGKKDSAIKFYQKAEKINPNSMIALSNLAIVYYEIKKTTLAEKVAKKVLEKDSQNYSALIVLGNISYSKKEYEKALSFYLLSYQSTNYTSCVNLANTYVELKKYDEAIRYALQAKEIDAEKAVPYSILGNAYKELEKNEEAIECLKKAISIDETDAWNYNYLSQIYQKLEDYQNALKFGYKAICKTRDLDNSHHINFGYLLYEISEQDLSLTKKFAQKWQKEFPQNQVVEYMANAVLQNEKILRANDEYLKNIFDVFAEDFEAVLSNLGYQAPEYVSEELEKIYGVLPKKKMNILDAGCGTGLCGVFLKKYAKVFGLHGVDISQKMLEVARAKKLYNKLFCMELVTFLKGQKQNYDLIVSSDVFTYFGDLSELFDGLSSALKDKGRLIFTISKNRINHNDFVLHSSGRFLHKKAYVEKILQEKGFQIEKMSEKYLRNEGDEKVMGYLVSALKNS